MASGRLADYLGVGLASERPATPDLFTDTLGVWYSTDTDVLSVWDGSVWEDIELSPAVEDETFQVAASDMTTDITTGTTKAYFRAPKGFTCTGVRASLATASTSGAVTVGINVDGTSLLTTDLTIDQDEKTSTTAATPAVIDAAMEDIADDAEITIDIDGAGTGAKGLIVTLIGTPAGASA